MILWIALVALLQTVDAPYKPNEEFEVKLDFQIKPRPFTMDDNNSKIDEFGKVERKKAENLPHLALNLNFLKLSADEVKVRIFKHSGEIIYSKKAKVGSVVHFEMGFIADIKQGLVANEYTIILYSAAKKATSKIHILIGGDGSYFVNGIQCGRF